VILLFFVNIHICATSSLHAHNEFWKPTLCGLCRYTPDRSPALRGSAFQCGVFPQCYIASADIRRIGVRRYEIRKRYVAPHSNAESFPSATLPLRIYAGSESGATRYASATWLRIPMRSLSPVLHCLCGYTPDRSPALRDTQALRGSAFQCGVFPQCYIASADIRRIGVRRYEIRKLYVAPHSDAESFPSATTICFE